MSVKLSPMESLNHFALYAGHPAPAEAPDMAMRCPICQEELVLERHISLSLVLAKAAEHIATHGSVFG